MSLFRIFAVPALALLFACSGSRPPTPKNLPAPINSTTVGPGDVFEVAVLGEKDLPKEYRVQPDGTVAFPYVGRMNVAGREPQDIEEFIRTSLVEKKILSDPQVTLVVKQYNSKNVSIIGAVQRSGNIPWFEGMKLVDAISRAGWFTALADSNHVILTRHVSKDKTVTVYVSVDAITDGTQPDIALQAGDTIKVEQRPW